VNHAVLNCLPLSEITVEIHKVEDVELDEMWSYSRPMNYPDILIYCIAYFVSDKQKKDFTRSVLC
jgi:hypothetical protein